MLVRSMQSAWQLVTPLIGMQIAEMTGAKIDELTALIEKHK